MFGVSLYENPNILKKKWSGPITEDVNARETVALTLLFGDETEISVLDWAFLPEASRRTCRRA